jgi:hypothetical protein
VTSTPILPTRQTNPSRTITTSTQGSTLADILERVLDKGIVIAGDISVSIASTELLHIRIRLLISSVDKAKEMGINWWENDPYLSTKAQSLVEENQRLQQRLESLEAQMNIMKSAIEEGQLTLANTEAIEESRQEIIPLSIDNTIEEEEESVIEDEQLTLVNTEDNSGEINQESIPLLSIDTPIDV